MNVAATDNPQVFTDINTAMARNYISIKYFGLTFDSKTNRKEFIAALKRAQKKGVR